MLHPLPMELSLSDAENESAVPLARIAAASKATTASAVAIGKYFLIEMTSLSF